MVTAGDGATPPPGPRSAGPGHGHRHRRRRRGQRPAPGPRRPARRPGRYPAARWPRSRATCSGRSADNTGRRLAHRPGVPQPADSQGRDGAQLRLRSPQQPAAAPVPARRARHGHACRKYRMSAGRLAALLMRPGGERAEVSRHGTPSRRRPAGCRCCATGTLPVCLPTRRGRAVSPPGLSRARTFTGFARLRPGTGEASPCIGSPVARTEFSVGDDERPLPMGQPTVRLPGRCPGR